MTDDDYFVRGDLEGYIIGSATITRGPIYDVLWPNEETEIMPGDLMASWKLFEVETPDGRVIRHRHPSLHDAQKALQDGYKVTGEVFGASSDDKGGVVGPIGPGTTSLMRSLLDAHGDELLAWLKKRGFESEYD